MVLYPMNAATQALIHVNELFNSIIMAMVEMTIDIAFTLANIKAMRLKSILSHLPPTYKSFTKLDLRMSSID